MIFALPPAEVAIHPAEENNVHEFYLMCDDIGALVNQMESLKVECSKVQQLSWGLLTKIELPGSGKLGIYQPLHARPKPMRVEAPKIKAA